MADAWVKNTELAALRRDFPHWDYTWGGDFGNSGPGGPIIYKATNGLTTLTATSVPALRLQIEDLAQYGHDTA